MPVTSDKEIVWEQMKRDCPSYARHLSKNPKDAKLVGEIIAAFGIININGKVLEDDYERRRNDGRK